MIEIENNYIELNPAGMNQNLLYQINPNRQ